MFCNFFSLVLKWFAWQYTFPLKLWLEVEISKEFAVWFGWLNKKNVYTQIFLRFSDTGFSVSLTVGWSDLILDRNLTTFHPLFLYKRASNIGIPDEICTFFIKNWVDDVRYIVYSFFFSNVKKGKNFQKKEIVI